MEKTPSDFQIIVPSYEIGSSPLPREFQEVWDEIEDDIKEGLKPRTWNDEINTEIRFVPPDQIGVPNNSDALMACLSDVAEQKTDLLSELGIAEDIDMQIRFIVYHEFRHKRHYEKSILHAFMTKAEIDAIEKDADDFARQRMEKLLQ